MVDKGSIDEVDIETEFPWDPMIIDNDDNEVEVN